MNWSLVHPSAHPLCAATLEKVGAAARMCSQTASQMLVVVNAPFGGIDALNN
jgi:hypothetical protein